MGGQHSLCAPLIHPGSSFDSSAFFPNHLPKFVLEIATVGTVILYCFSFLLLRRYSFSSLLRSAILHVRHSRTRSSRYSNLQTIPTRRCGGIDTTVTDGEMYGQEVTFYHRRTQQQRSSLVFDARSQRDQ